MGPLKYTKALYMDHIFLGTCIIFLWLMVDIYYEKDLTFIEKTTTLTIENDASPLR
jgi:hypothetical protein